jgi:hypothetical protein
MDIEKKKQETKDHNVYSKKVTRELLDPGQISQKEYSKARLDQAKINWKSSEKITQSLNLQASQNSNTVYLVFHIYFFTCPILSTV